MVRRGMAVSGGTVMVAAIFAACVTGAALVGSPKAKDESGVLQHSIDSGRARNVILFLGDGMGDSEITIARNYQVGAGGRVWMDTMPLTGAYTTYALQESNPALVDWRLAKFFAHESCGKCTPCREGSGWVEKVLYRIAHGRGRPGDLDLLVSVGNSISPGVVISVSADEDRLLSHGNIGEGEAAVGIRGCFKQTFPRENGDIRIRNRRGRP